MVVVVRGFWVMVGWGLGCWYNTYVVVSIVERGFIRVNMDLLPATSDTYVRKYLVYRSTEIT